MGANAIVGPLVAIVGETASGKSGLAMALAQRFEGEIISADAWSIYKGFDIGTAKPTVEDRLLVPHHLVDCIDPIDSFNVAKYKTQANAAVEDILIRSRLPILAGGSGLYVDSVLFDYQFRQGAIAGYRNQLNEMTNKQLLTRVADLGLSTEGVDTANNRRLVRLIETNGTLPLKSGLRANTVVIGLSISRESLDENINARVEGMFDAGLEDEVARLSQVYGWDIAPMQGIGYREFRAYFDGVQTNGETKQLIIRNTNNLAKKQRTWFRRNKSIHWVTEQQQAVDLVTTLLNNYRR